MFHTNATIDLDIEKKIITSLIVSNRIANDLVPITTPELFTLDLAKVIFTWIKEFHVVYGKACGPHIQDIYKSNKPNIKVTEQENYEAFLTHLSKEFASAEHLNEDYLLQQGKQYLHKRHLITTAEKMKEYAESDMLAEAEGCIQKYGSVIDSGLSDWKKPFEDRKYIGSTFTRKESDSLCRLGGAIDTLLGPVKSSWLMAILAPAKRGKTAALKDFTMWIMNGNRKVSFHSLEMEDTDISISLYQNIMSAPSEDNSIIYPMFDCELNQKNSCNDPKRINRIKKPKDFSPSHPYQPCDLCRSTDPQYFIPAIWYHSKKRKGLNRKDTIERLEALSCQFNPNLLRLKSYPIDSANVQTIDRDLKMLELAEGWIPDVIIIDYADILMPEKNGLEGRDKENATWKALKKLAQKRKALVITATQGNRGSFKLQSLEEESTSEDIRKLAHVDVAITINQTEEEKEKGYARIAILNHRWKTFNKNKQAMILQQLEVGQFHYDSVIVNVKDEKKGR